MRDRFYTNNNFDTSSAQSLEASVIDTLDSDVVLHLEASGFAGSESVSFYAVQSLRLTRSQARDIAKVLQDALDEYDEAVALALFDAERDSEPDSV